MSSSVGHRAATCRSRGPPAHRYATLGRMPAELPGGRWCADCSWPRSCWWPSSPPSSGSSAGGAAAKRRRSSSSSSCPTTSSATGCGRISRWCTRPPSSRRRSRPTRRACATRDIGPKPPGERRVVVLGDSLVLAVQVPREATFCARLEARLNAGAPAGVRYRVINAGVQGYGPVEELLFYRRVASRFDADLVLVATFVANDAVEAFDAAWRLDGSRPPAVAVRRRDRAHAAPHRAPQHGAADRPPARGPGARPGRRHGRAEPAGGELSGDAAAVHHRRSRRGGAAPSGRCRARSQADGGAPGDRADAGALPARSGRVRAAARRRPSRWPARSRRTSRPSASAPPLAPLGLPTVDLLPRAAVGAARPVLRRHRAPHRRRPRDGGGRARGVHPARAPPRSGGRARSGLQLDSLRRLLRDRLRGLPAARASRPEPAGCSPPATTSTPPGTGASPGCWRRRRWSATGPRAALGRPACAPRARRRAASCGPRSASCSPCSASSSTPASSSTRRRARCRPSASTSAIRSLAIVLPLGISFYTFMAMAYVVDVYRGDMAPIARAWSTTRSSSPTSRTSWPGRSCGRRR